MESLVRTKSGRFTLKDSVSLSRVQEAAEQGTVSELVIGIEEILEEYPRLCCIQNGDRLLMNGNPLTEEMVQHQHREGWVRMCTSQALFAGIYAWDDKKKNIIR